MEGFIQPRILTARDSPEAQHLASVCLRRSITQAHPLTLRAVEAGAVVMLRPTHATTAMEAVVVGPVADPAAAGVISGFAATLMADQAVAWVARVATVGELLLGEVVVHLLPLLAAAAAAGFFRVLVAQVAEPTQQDMAVAQAAVAVVLAPLAHQVGLAPPQARIWAMPMGEPVQVAEDGAQQVEHRLYSDHWVVQAAKLSRLTGRP